MPGPLLPILAVGGVIGLLAAANAPSREERVLRRRVRGSLATAARVLQIEVPPLAFSRRVPNAASDGWRILVNPDWATNTLLTYCDDHQCNLVVLTGVLAHELAHHVHADARCPEPGDGQERRADFFAGVVLGYLGVDSDHFERVLHDLSAHAGPHPRYAPGWLRASDVREGAEHGRWLRWEHSVQ